MADSDILGLVMDAFGKVEAGRPVDFVALRASLSMAEDRQSILLERETVPDVKAAAAKLVAFSRGLRIAVDHLEAGDTAGARVAIRTALHSSMGRPGD
jgi:hypothetical protein